MNLDLTISESVELGLGERGLGLATMGLDYISEKKVSIYKFLNRPNKEKYVSFPRNQIK